MSRDHENLRHSVGGALRSYQRSVDAFDEVVARFLGVNRTDLRALDVLLEQGQATPGYLADALGLTTGSITAMVDRLEKLGFVERRPDPSDRRRVAVRPTARLNALAERIYGPLAESGVRVLAGYSKRELELLIRALQEIQAEQETQTERVRSMLPGSGGAAGS